MVYFVCVFLLLCLCICVRVFFGVFLCVCSCCVLFLHVSVSACLLRLVRSCVRAVMCLRVSCGLSVPPCVFCVRFVCLACSWVSCLCLLVDRNTTWLGPKQKDSSRPRHSPRARRVLSRYFLRPVRHLVVFVLCSDHEQAAVVAAGTSTAASVASAVGGVSKLSVCNCCLSIVFDLSSFFV